MKVAALVGERKFVIEEKEIPAIGRDEALVRIMACGVCLSELPLWLGEREVSYPSYLGHEVSGIVEKTGSGVKDFKQGDRITAVLWGRGYSEYVNIPEKDLIKIDSRIPFKEALGEPIGCCISAMKRCGITIGDVVAIAGTGFMGLILLQLIHGYGASKVIAIDVRDKNLSLARKLGADITLNSQSGDLVDEVLKLTEDGRGVDVVLEVAGKQETLDICSKIVRIRGRMLIVGYHSVGIRTVDMEQWNWKGIDVINAHERDKGIYYDSIKIGMDLLSAKRFTLKPLVTHLFKLDEINDAFQAAYEKPDCFIKSVVVV